MCRILGGTVALIILAIALLLEPVIKPWHRELNKAPADESIGTVEVLSSAQLRKTYEGRRVLLVGGTRGVGRGTALAVAGAGAHVVVVGRSEKSGLKTLAELRAVAGSEQQLEFVQGDLGSAASAKALLKRLADFSAEHGMFDYFVQSAAVFPDWSELHQQDGLEKGFAITVLGRYILYKHADKFLKHGGRVLNVLASGTVPLTAFNRSLATGESKPRGLIEAIMTWAIATELMQIGLGQHGEHHGTTRVSTNPGLLGTDLHDGQGLLMDIFEPIAVALMGISEEECGVRQASIMASAKLGEGSLSYVDEHMRGRLISPELQKEADEHLSWLWEFINSKAA